MSLLTDAQRLVKEIRNDEQARGWDSAFASMIERLSIRLEDLEQQIENKVDKPYQR